MRQETPQLFQPADYGNEYAAMAGYLFSAAWAWMARQEESSGLIFYTDV